MTQPYVISSIGVANESKMASDRNDFTYFVHIMERVRFGVKH